MCLISVPECYYHLFSLLKSFYIIQRILWPWQFSCKLELFILFDLGFFFFWTCLQHAEVPGPRIKPAPQQQPEPLKWQCWLLNQLHHKRTPQSCCFDLYLWYIYFYFSLSESQELLLIPSSSGFKPKDTIVLHLPGPLLLHWGKRQESRIIHSLPPPDKTPLQMKTGESHDLRRLPAGGQQASCSTCESLWTRRIHFRAEEMTSVLPLLHG